MFVKIKVYTEEKREWLHKKSGDSFDMHIKEPAEQGLANKKVIELLRKHFKGYNKIKIIKGHHSPNKIISLEK